MTKAKQALDFPGSHQSASQWQKSSGSYSMNNSTVSNGSAGGSNSLTGSNVRWTPLQSSAEHALQGSSMDASKMPEDNMIVRLRSAINEVDRCAVERNA
jgi:hypothetical protein